MKISYRVVVNCIRLFVQGYGRLSVVGAEKIPRSGPVLIIANHDSPLDALMIAAAVRRRELRVLTKRSLWDHRFLRVLLEKFDQIPIERGSSDSNGLEGAIAALRSGHTVCVFPEGTLSRGERLRVRSGAARLLAAVPETTVIGCALAGGANLRRSRLSGSATVVFFAVARSDDGETWAAQTVLGAMDVVRTIAPPAPWPAQRSPQYPADN